MITSLLASDLPVKRSKKRPSFGIKQFSSLGHCLYPVEMATELEGILDIFVRTQFDVSLPQARKCDTDSAKGTKNCSIQNL